MANFNSKVSFVVKGLRQVFDISLILDITFTKTLKDEPIELPEMDEEAEGAEIDSSDLLHELRDPLQPMPVLTQQSRDASAPQHNPAPVPQPRKQRTPEMLNDISKRIREADREQKESEPDLALEIEIDEVLTANTDCSMCGGSSFVDTLCSECDAPICQGCVVESIHDGEQYCEDCWDKL